MIPVVCTLFQCFRNGKMIVDSNRLDIHVFFIFAQEKSCVRVDSGVAKYVYENTDDASKFVFEKSLTQKEIYSSFHFTCDDFSGNATCDQAMRNMARKTTSQSSSYLLLNEEYVFPKISSLTNVVLSFSATFAIITLVYLLIFNWTKPYMGFFERACVFFNF